MDASSFFKLDQRVTSLKPTRYQSLILNLGSEYEIWMYAIPKQSRSIVGRVQDKRSLATLPFLREMGKSNTLSARHIIFIPQ